MNNKNTLLLSPFFYPEIISTGKYNTWLAQELVAHGASLTVASSYPIYPDWEPARTEVTLPGMSIIRGGGWLSYPGSALLRRAILELWYSWFAFSKYMGLKSKPECVIAIFPPSLFFLLLSTVLPRRSKKIGIVHDLQGVYASRSKGLIGRIINGVIHAVERKCFASCDRLIFLSKTMAKRAIEEYSLDEGKSAVCYPFVALPTEMGNDGQALARLFNSEKINVVYSGALGEKQNPDELLNFFNDLSIAREDIDCHIFSAGPYYERLRARQAEKGRIKFHDLVESEHIGELYARSDVQVIPQAVGTSEGSLPSKLPNLMAAGVPIFAVCEQGSELGELVLAANAGSVCNTWEPARMVQSFIGALPQMLEEQRSVRFVRLQRYISDTFNIRNVINEIKKVSG